MLSVSKGDAAAGRAEGPPGLRISQLRDLGSRAHGANKAPLELRSEPAGVGRVGTLTWRSCLVIFEVVRVE